MPASSHQYHWHLQWCPTSAGFWALEITVTQSLQFWEESGEATENTTFISNNFSLAHFLFLLWLLSECGNPTLRAGKCVCKEHSDWWHSVFHLESTSWSVPRANSDITPAGNSYGWLANLALSLSCTMFYSGIKLTSDNDKTSEL